MTPEGIEARHLVTWLDLKQIAFAWVPNLTTSARNASNQKAQGLQPGFPDYVIMLPDGRALFWELKPPGKKPAPRQRKWLERLANLGFPVGWGTTKEAIKFVQEHL